MAFLTPISNGGSAGPHDHDDRYYTESEIDATLAGYSASGHTHDDRYYTEDEITSFLALKAPLASPTFTGTFTAPSLVTTSTTLGAFGVTPSTRAIATADIKDALTAYGLLQGTSATPLNLDGGALTGGAISGTTGSFSSTLASTTTHTHTRNSLAATSTDGIIVTNSTAATVGTTVQTSPRLRLRGSAWKSNATAASQTHDWIVENLPATGAASTTSTLRFGNSNNGAAYTYPVTISDTGTLTATAFVGAGVGLTSLPSHTHAIADVSGLTTTLNSFVADLNAHATNTAPHSATSANTASRLVLRDASGSFAAGGITAESLSVASSAFQVDGDGDVIANGITCGAISAQGDMTFTDSFAGNSYRQFVQSGIEIYDIIDRVYNNDYGDNVYTLDGGGNGYFASSVTTGSFYGGSATITDAVSARRALLTTGTITSSTPAIDLTQTWNASGTTFTGIKLNITQTASAAASKYLDFQAGGTSRFTVNRDGKITINAPWTGVTASGSLLDMRDGLNRQCVDFGAQNDSGYFEVRYVNGSAYVRSTCEYGSAQLVVGSASASQGAALSIACGSGTNWAQGHLNAANTDHEFSYNYASNPTFALTSQGRVSIRVANSEPADAELRTGHAILYLDESSNTLKVKSRYSDGTTIKKGDVAALS